MPARDSHQFDTLVLDLDETVYAWTPVWANATRFLVDAVRRCDARLDVPAALSRVFRRHRSMEVPSLLQEIAGGATLSRGAREDIAREHSSIWQRELRVFPGVERTLKSLRRRGVRVIGWTDSPLLAAGARLRIAGLVDAFDLVLCSGARERTGDGATALLPIGSCRPHSRARWAADCVKGTPQALLDVLSIARTPPERALVVGDNRARDVQPAIEAGVRAYWARYGLRRRDEDVALLDALSYWTPNAWAAAW